MMFGISQRRCLFIILSFDRTSFSTRIVAICFSISFTSGGRVIELMRARAPASSMTSIALSGRKRPVIYRSESRTAASSAEATYARIHLQRVCDGRAAMILVVNPAKHPVAQAHAKQSLGRQRCGQQFGSWREGG